MLLLAIAAALLVPPSAAAQAVSGSGSQDRPSASQCASGESPRECYHRALALAVDSVEVAAGPELRERLRAHARAMLLETCEAGVADGCYLSGHMTLVDAPDDPALQARAADLFERGCTAAEPSGAACNALAEAYVHGLGRDASEPEALANFRRACDAGHAFACYHASWRYPRDRNLSREQSDSLRTQMVRRSCTLGSITGCVSQAVVMESSLDSLGRAAREATQDSIRSIYRARCADGHQFACANMGTVYRWGAFGTEANVDSVLYYYTAACRGVEDERQEADAHGLRLDPYFAGRGAGCRHLGNVLLEGELSFLADTAAAIEHYRRGCRLYDHRSCALEFRSDWTSNGNRPSSSEQLYNVIRTCHEEYGDSCYLAGFALMVEFADTARGVDFLARGCDLHDSNACGAGRPADLAALGVRGERLPAVGRELVRGSFSGALGGASLLHVGRRYDVWLFDGVEGDEIRIDLQSSDFDAYLYLFDGESGELLERNDDFGGGLDSRILFDIAKTGRYAVVASTHGFQREGDYRLSMQNASFPVTLLHDFGRTAAQLAAAPLIQMGDAVDHRITHDSPSYQPRDRSVVRHFEPRRYRGTAGEWVRIDHESSDFDAYLYLFDLATGEMIAYDDDGGAGLNSRIEVQLPRDGEYLIVPTSFGHSAGRYRLALRPGSPGDTGAADGGAGDTAPVGPAAGRPGALADLGLSTAQLAAAPAIAAGESWEGALGPQSPAHAGRPFDVWVLAGSAGQRVRIDHRSSDFDAYLYLFDMRSGALLAFNDDGGAGLDSRIEHQLPRTGSYVVLPSSFGTGATGAYTLSVTEMTPVDEVGLPGLLELASGATRLVRGESAQGRLGSGSPLVLGHRAELFTFSGSAGEEVVIDVESSDFDAYVVLIRASDGSEVGSDDDGGEGLNARLSVTLPAAGEYVVIARGFVTEPQGRFTVTVR